MSATAPSEEAPPPDAAAVDAEIAALGERVGLLIETLSANADPEVGTQLNELLDGIDHLHREALTRLSGLLEHHDLLRHACEDPVVGAAFDLYELRPDGADDEDTGGSGPPGDGGSGRPPGLIPLNAGLGGVSASAPAGPGATPAPASLPMATVPPAPRSMVPLDDLEVGRSPGASRQAVPISAPVMPARAAVAAPPEDEPAEWFEVCSVHEVAPGTIYSPDEGALVFSNVDGEIRAFRNGCGNGPLALHMGRIIDDRRLACPWHIGCVYDMSTGVSGDPPDQRRLIQYPIRIDGDTVMVAFNKGAIPAAREATPSTPG